MAACEVRSSPAHNSRRVLWRGSLPVHARRLWLGRWKAALCPTMIPAARDSAGCSSNGISLA
eukprot:1810158-Pyramimonas_sp.AAC.1